MKDSQIAPYSFPDKKSGKAAAVFAGGCFWCMEAPFEKLNGVSDVISGYTGGDEVAPSYQEVSSGRTGHAESVLVIYDPEKITYRALLDIFWRNINPVQKDGQFYDRGPQYRTAIFYLDDEQRIQAEQSKKDLSESHRFRGEIATEITAAGQFWRAEEYHQDYYKKNPQHYNNYRKGSGRDDFIQKNWEGPQN